MNNAVTRSNSHGVSPIALALAYAANIACSGNYPLGDVSRDDQLLEGAEASASEQADDARVGALLAPPDVTISGVNAGPTTLVAAGDLDGDGYWDMAVTSIDGGTGVPFVQLRYGAPRPVDAEAAFAFDRSGAFLTLDASLPLYVFAAGDVDGDGHADLIVKTMDCEVTQQSEGSYLVYGGERLAGTLSLPSVAAYFAPPLRDDTIGEGCRGPASAAGPGDMDGDGIDDFVLASPPPVFSARPLTDRSGDGVYVFYGRAERFAGDLRISDADASFHSAHQIDPSAVGDVNGDGLGDLLVTPAVSDPQWPRSFMIPGRVQRHGGRLDLAANSLLIAGAVPDWPNQVHGGSDLDADGHDDLLLRDAGFRVRLLYGSPAAFESGVDITQGDAEFPQSERGLVYAVGDRDGDGDDELLDLFGVPRHETDRSVDVAFISGSRERFTGEMIFPESEVIAQTPNGRFPYDPYRLLTSALPAGDLDGDGAADLFTVSERAEPLGEGSYQVSDFQLHIHYGTPASSARNPR